MVKYFSIEEKGAGGPSGHIPADLSMIYNILEYYYK